MCQRLQTLQGELTGSESNKLQSLQEHLAAVQRENSNLQCEIEVLEGENSRRTTDIDILESENNRLRTDVEMTAQSTQILEAEKESSLMEIQRLEQGRDRLGSEVQVYITQRDEALEEIRVLQRRLHEVEMQQTPSDTVMSAELADEELDWGSEGSKEQEHIQRSSSVDSALQKELDSLKQQCIDSEKEINTLTDELQASKIKCGKLLQKLKASQSKSESLLKDVERLKSNKGGLSNLDQALQDEYKSQVNQAQTDRDELKQRIEVVIKENEQLSKQSEVLKDAQDRLLEMKEDQGVLLRGLKSRNKELESEVSSMEWRITELEETVELSSPALGGSPTPAKMTPPSSASPIHASTGDTKQLRDQVIALETQLDELSSSNMKIESLNKDLQERITELDEIYRQLALEKESLECEVSNTRKETTKASQDVNVYKEAFIQQQEQFEKLTDEKNSLNQKFDEVQYERRAIATEYNALYHDVTEMQKDHAALK